MGGARAFSLEKGILSLFIWEECLADKSRLFSVDGGSEFPVTEKVKRLRVHQSEGLFMSPIRAGP